MPHRPHFPSNAILPGGTRFVAPHAAQPTITLSEFDIGDLFCFPGNSREQPSR
jgi:hypothetical protein